MKPLALLATALALAAAVLPARAQDAGWQDAQGHPLAQTAARRSLDGLAGSLLVTPDANWRAKWDTSPTTTPQFTQARTVARGEQVFILIFFANPQSKADGSVDLTCDIDAMRPDGTSSIHQDDVACFRGKLLGGRYNTYLAAPVIGFTGDASDPLGTWTIRVALKDNLRHVVLPLTTSFVLR